MSSTILYKFRSGTSFETLPLPGTSARLFDVKRAIVRAKGLDGGGGGGATMEFDLSVRNANTDEVYDDEAMILPRGIRIVVRRVAAERGRGILSRIAAGRGGGHGGGGGGGGGGGASSAGMGGDAARDGFYTIRSRDRAAADVFLASPPPPPPPSSSSSSSAPAPPPTTHPAAANEYDDEVDESRELEALRAVTDQAGSVYGASATTSSSSARAARDPRLAGQGGAGGGGGGMPPPHTHFARPPPKFHGGGGGAGGGGGFRPNADPELRQQEMMGAPQPKKRATGIPRTFLTLGAGNPPPTGAGDGGGGKTTGGRRTISPRGTWPRSSSRPRRHSRPSCGRGGGSPSPPRRDGGTSTTRSSSPRRPFPSTCSAAYATPSSRARCSCRGTRPRGGRRASRAYATA